MARDNGSRGSYRNNDETEQKEQQQEPFNPEYSVLTATPPTTFQNLNHSNRDNNPTGTTDRFFDQVPADLNARFPVGSVPGSLPRHNSFFGGSLQRPVPVTWKDIVIANLILGFAAIGFVVILCDGAKYIFGFIWALFSAILMIN